MQNRKSLFAQLTAVTIVLLAFGAYIYMNGGASFAPESSTLGFVAKSKPITYDYNAQPGFYSPGNGSFFFYARNSVSYRNTDGEVIWSEAHDQTSPVGFGAGEYLALAENHGSSLRVYNAAGQKYSAAFDKPVLNFSVNEAGYAAVRLQDGSGYHMWIYNPDGEQIYGRSHASPNLFPIACALSANGRELAFSVLDVNGVDMTSRLSISHTNADTEWAGWSKDGQLIASLKFNGNNDLIAASESEITHYRITDSGKTDENASVAFANEVRQLAYIGDAGVAVALGPGIVGMEAAEAENTVRFYSASLDPVNSFQSPRAVTYLYGDSHGVIVGTNQTYYGFSAKGTRLWQYAAPMELIQIIYLNNTDTVLEVGRTQARVLKREKIQAEEAETE